MAPVKSNSTRSKGTMAPAKKSRSSKVPRPPPKQQKTKRPTPAATTTAKARSKQKKAYTAGELGVPTLNGIVPAGVTKPKGKKKGKVFVDDQERMMMILGIVNAEVEGKVESKIMRQRQLEEVREARRLDAEKRENARKGVLEAAKDEIRSKKKSRTKGDASQDKQSEDASKSTKNARKKVSFAA